MVNRGVWARACLVLGLIWGSFGVQAGEAAKAAPAPLPLAELRTFAEVFNRIKVAYVEEVDDRTLLENAISGMLTGLDPIRPICVPRILPIYRSTRPVNLVVWVSKWGWTTVF